MSTVTSTVTSTSPKTDNVDDVTAEPTVSDELGGGLLAVAVGCLRAGIETGWQTRALEDDDAGAARIAITAVPIPLVLRPGPVIQPAAPTEPSQGTDAWTDDEPPGVVGPIAGELDPPLEEETPAELLLASAGLFQQGVRIGWLARTHGRAEKRINLTRFVEAVRKRRPSAPTNPEQGIDVVVEPDE